MARAGCQLIRSVFATLLVVCLLAVSPFGASVVIADESGVDLPAEHTSDVTASTESVRSVESSSLPEIDIDADVILMEARIAENGSAAWRVTYQIQLADDADIEAFEQLQTEIETDPSAYLDPFEERMDRTVTAAESATDREMTATDFQITTERESQPQSEFGLVTFTFQWSGFAAADGDEIRAGDAVDSLFLDDGERLELQWPSAYGIQSRTPAPQTVQSDEVVWRGPIDFDSGEPRIVVSTEATGGSGGANDGESGPDGPGGDGQTSPNNTGIGLPMLSALGVVGLTLVATTVLFFRRQTDTEPPDDGTATATDQQQTPPAELLSNEERVLQLLKQNGGRMKQKQVAEQLDWTAAKTSQVVGDLRDDDEVEVFRLGRENVLTLPGVDLEASGDDQPEDGGDTA
jgi:uncharacterized membrane protein